MGVYPKDHLDSISMVYLPRFTLKINTSCIGEYSIHMDPMVYIFYKLISKQNVPFPESKEHLDPKYVGRMHPFDAFTQSPFSKALSKLRPCIPSILSTLQRKSRYRQMDMAGLT